MNMKNLMAVSFVMIAMIGCGGKSSDTNTAAANQCQAGYYNNGSGCVPQNQQNLQLQQQQCISNVGYTWDQATQRCIPTNQNGVPNQNITQYPNQTGQVPPGQNCPPGQYFNGATCSVIVGGQANCINGQVPTQAYGCVIISQQCENQYAYMNSMQQSQCIPAPILVRATGCNSDYYNTGYYHSSCGRGSINVNTRRGRRAMSSGSIKKVRYNRDGSIRRVRHYR